MSRFAGEYALAALLAIVLVYTLAFSHMYHIPFSTKSSPGTHWWKARLDVTGWIEQHQEYVEEAVAAAASPVLSLPPCLVNLVYSNRTTLLPQQHVEHVSASCI